MPSCSKENLRIYKFILKYKIGKVGAVLVLGACVLGREGPRVLSSQTLR